MLHSFDETDGAYPAGILAEGGNGDLYSVTSGGVFNGGTVFRVAPDGTFSTLHEFTGSDGERPATGTDPGDRRELLRDIHARWTEQ